MRRLAAFFAEHRRTAARLVAVVALLAVALELWPSVPRDTQLEFRLGPQHGDIVELRVAYVQGQHELHGVSFRFQDGAPQAVRHTVRLPSGEFILHCETRDRAGRARSQRRKLVTPADGLIRIRLSEQESARRPEAPAVVPAQRYASLHASAEEQSDDSAGWGAPNGFAGRGEGSRDPSQGRAAGPTIKESR